MSPSKRSPAKKPARRPAARKAPARRPARKRGKAARKPARKPAPRRAAPARPVLPPKPAPWSADIAELNLAYYEVTDWERAKVFYGVTLGLPVAMADEATGWIEYGRALPHLAISRASAPGPLPVEGGATVVLTCPDVRGAIERLRGKGVRVGEIQEIPGMVILGTFYDPDGNRIQLAQSLPG